MKVEGSQPSNFVTYPYAEFKLEKLFILLVFLLFLLKSKVLKVKGAW